MKIIGIGNFDLDYVSDILIASNVNEHYGEQIVQLLQEATSEHDIYYPQLVDDNYELYQVMP